MKQSSRSPLVLALLTLVASSALAQSAKNAVKLSNVALLPQVSTSGSSTAVAGSWTSVLATTLKTSQQKDVVIGVSLEAGLFTDTKVASKTGTRDTSNAESVIEVQVLVDGVPAEPGAVIFARRAQTLMAKLGGILTSCTDLNGDGTIVMDECLFEDEEIQLVLDTMNAASFTFALDDVGVGTHAISVQARIVLLTSSQNGSATAAASIGKGSVSVEEVRLVKDIVLTN